MSFVWKRPEGRLKSPEQCAREILEVARARGLDEFAAVLATMCVAQESDFWCPWNLKDPSSRTYPFDSESNDGRSVGYFQQQNGRAGDILPTGDRDNWWGSMAQRMDLKRSCNEFLSRLQNDYAVSNRPAAASEVISNVQGPRPDLRGAYAKHWDRAWTLVRAVSTPEGNQVGDPIWLPDVLRAAGLQCDIYPGAFERGHGDFGSIWGVVCHHTGSYGETPHGIAEHPTLGLASQLHLSRDGIYTLCGVGVAWHAGNGSWPGLPTNGANQATIGIEAANDGGGRPGLPHRYDNVWSDAQYDAYVRGVAAILRKLGYDSSHCIGHKDWAGPAQGKWDPGAIDMNIFRNDVQQQISGKDPLMGVNIDRLNQAVDKLLATSPQRCIYRDTDKDDDDTVGKIWSTHGMTLEMVVEHQALLGDVGSLLKLKRLADGQGPAGKTDWAVARAKNVLAKALAANPGVKL